MIKKCEKATKGYHMCDYFLHDSTKNRGYQLYTRWKMLIIHRYQINCARRIYEEFALKMQISEFDAIMKCIVDEDMQEKERDYCQRSYVKKTCSKLYESFPEFKNKENKYEQFL